MAAKIPWQRLVGSWKSPDDGWWCLRASREQAHFQRDTLGGQNTDSEAGPAQQRVFW